MTRQPLFFWRTPALLEKGIRGVLGYGARLRYLKVKTPGGAPCSCPHLTTLVPHWDNYFSLGRGQMSRWVQD